MITVRELDGAIRECENAPTSYQNCEKLATFYTILDHIQEEPQDEYSYDAPNGIDDFGESDFLQAVKGQNEADIWSILDELMDTILITNPRLYQGVMRKIKGQI